MTKIISAFKKIARLVTIILLFVAAIFNLYSMFSSFDGNSFMGIVGSIFSNLLMICLFLAPAILLLLKRDKEGFVTLGILLGYLFVDRSRTFISQGALVTSDAPTLSILWGIFVFILGLVYAFALICFLLSKLFGLKSMLIGEIVLLASFVLLLVIFVLEIIIASKYNWTFAQYLNNLLLYFLIPSIMVFGLLLIEDVKSSK